MLSTLTTDSRVKKGVIAATFLLSLILLRNLWQTWQLTAGHTAKPVSIEELEQKRDMLRQEIQEEATVFSREKSIRNELNMQKEGELLLQLPPLPTLTPIPLPSPTPTQTPIHAWKELIF